MSKHYNSSNPTEQTTSREAIFLAGGFELFAPWGQKQTVAAGHLVLNAGEVYGNNAETFEATHKVLY